MKSEEQKLAEAREHLKYDPQQVQDGINYAQWREWAGEEVTLNREESAWVWMKLQELDRAKDLINKIQNFAESKWI